MSLVEVVQLRRIAESYGLLPRAEHFAELRDASFADEAPGPRDPAKLAEYRKRYEAKKLRSRG